MIGSLLLISMTEELSGVPQVPAGALYSCQECRRYPQVPCTAVRSAADIGLLSLSICQGDSLGDFLLAPLSPREKVTL